MPRNKKILASITAAFAVILIFLSGCTPPVYHHSITHNYDVNGKLIGIEETESITQRSPSTSPMKVKITQKDKLEK